jgi:hypothetical protein
MDRKPFKVRSCPLADPSDDDHWVYKMEVGEDERALAEHRRRELIMSHSPELLHELRAATELLMKVLDHRRIGTPLPSRAAKRNVVIDAWNVIDLAEGRTTKGNIGYPPSE